MSIFDKLNTNVKQIYEETVAPKIPHSSCYLIGIMDEFPPCGNAGDMVMTHSGDIYYYNKGEWIPFLPSVSTDIETRTEEKEEPTPRIKYPTNCKNCGAILNGWKCEYCGTEYK